MVSVFDAQGRIRPMHDMEKDILTAAIATGLHLTTVASRLEISRSTLYRLMGQYGLDRDQILAEAEEAEAKQ
jgi:DNA-binding NtrC family response regulator